MIIRGKIAFKKKPGILPPKSCLRLEFKDTGMADVSSVLYKEESIDVSGVDLSNGYQYKLKTKKPKLLHSSYSVSAVLNVGWCAKSSSSKWIQKKDYLTDTAFDVDLSKSGKNEYERDLFLVWYCKYFF